MKTEILKKLIELQLKIIENYEDVDIKDIVNDLFDIAYKYENLQN